MPDSGPDEPYPPQIECGSFGTFERGCGKRVAQPYANREDGPD